MTMTAPRRVLRLLAAVAAAAMVATSTGQVVHWHSADLAVPHDWVGRYLDVATGATNPAGAGPEAVPGWDLHLVGADALFFEAGSAAAALGGFQYARIPGTPFAVSNLPWWTPIDGSMNWAAGEMPLGGVAPFLLGSEWNLVGFRFRRELTGTIHYGWMRLELGPTLAAPRRILEYAFEAEPLTMIPAGFSSLAARNSFTIGEAAGLAEVRLGGRSDGGDWRREVDKTGVVGAAAAEIGGASAEATLTVRVDPACTPYASRVRVTGLARAEVPEGSAAIAFAEASSLALDPETPGLLLRVEIFAPFRIVDRSRGDARVDLWPRTGAVLGDRLQPGTYWLRASVGARATDTQPSAESVLDWDLRFFPLRGDIDGDGLVDLADLSILLANWGDPEEPLADLDGDGVVDGVDLSILLSAWQPPW